MKRRVCSCCGDSVEDRKISSPNAYVMAVIMAGLAAVFSVVGGYLLAQLQSKHVAIQRLHEHRLTAYETFLQRIGAVPGVSEILNAGAMASDLMTDSELEIFEDRAAKLLREHRIQDLYWRLNAEMQLIRLYGTPQVREICDDILSLLLMRHAEVGWNRLPPTLRAFYRQTLRAQEVGTAYGVTEQVTEDERLMIIVMPQLMQVLMDQLRTELHRTVN